MRYVGWHEYVRTALKAAEYHKDTEVGCVAATVPVLPGCMTQADNFEEARDNLIDAIELWIMVGLREGEEMPEVNGVRLATSQERFMI
ncbi:MAG: type II toxin-antitoxin system HicB family antitoxin [Deltaproteobacteria bacterium]|nr:type II toxin-antitoxin system HicB family antitoxin [Deltaproteobacteria bacterium]